MDKPNRVSLPTLDDTPFEMPPPVEQGAPAPVPDPPPSNAELEAQIVERLKTCYDPEIPVNIYELGLIYAIAIDPDRAVNIQMTLTSPSCPAAGSLPGDVQRKAASVPGVKSVKVDLAWEPPWDPSRMSEGARLQLGID